MMEDAENPIIRLLAPAVARLGFELIDARRHAAPKARRDGGLLRVMIDRAVGDGAADDDASGNGAAGNRAAGGVSLADCETVSREVGRLLAAEGIAYRALEVSSPGPNRPLNNPADFRRFAGRRAKVVLRAARDGRARFAGNIVRAGEDEVVLECEGGCFSFAFADIAAAKLAPNDQESRHAA